MPANQNPIFGKNVRFPSVAIMAGNTSSFGNGTIGTDLFLLYTIGADGAYGRKIIWLPTATTPLSTTVTVGRIFISSVSAGVTNNPSRNTWLIKEIPLGAANAASATVANNELVYILQDGLEPNDSILVSCHAAPAANTSWVVSASYSEY